jgi:CBS domain-containing protein
MQSKVRKVLETKGDQIISAQSTTVIDDIVRVMNDNHIGAVVIKEGETVVGILTERDLLKKLLAAHKDPSVVTAGEIMTDQIVIATADRTCEECMAIMVNHHVRHLPIYDGKELVGIISIGDLMKRLVSDRTTEVEHLQEYIAGPYAS